MTPGWGWETRQSHVAVTHWKLFSKTFTETVCPTAHAKPCKKSALYYSFLERRVEGAKAVVMSVSKVCETGGCAARMGRFAVCAKVKRAKPLRSTVSVGTQLKPVCVLFLDKRYSAKVPQVTSALQVHGRKVPVGGLAGPPAVRDKSFWEMCSTNISSSSHRQKHNNTTLLSFPNLCPLASPMWASALPGSRASL